MLPVTMSPLQIIVYAAYLLIHALPYIPFYIRNQIRNRRAA